MRKKQQLVWVYKLRFKPLKSLHPTEWAYHLIVVLPMFFKCVVQITVFVVEKLEEKSIRSMTSLLSLSADPIANPIRITTYSHTMIKR